MMASNAVQAILGARESLDVARQGLADMKGTSGRAKAGLMNAITWTRAATFKLQNMKGNEPNFEEWYVPKQQQMSDDPLLKYMVDVRNKFEKTPHTHYNRTMTLTGNFNEFLKTVDRPPNAVGFFMSDLNSGCGWIVQTSENNIEKHYFEVPDTILSISFNLSDAPPPYDKMDAYDVVEHYIDKISALVEEAFEKFAKPS